MPKSRGNKEGSYRKTDSGKWEGSVMVGLKPNGRPLIKYATRETLADAKSAIREILDSYQPAQVDGKTSLSEFADVWYKEYDGKVEKSTYDSYQYTLAHIKATWGKKAIGKITTEDIEKGLETLAGSVSFSYLGKVKTMLGQIFRRAEVKGAIRHGYNPMNGLDRLRDTKGGKPKKDAYTIPEIVTMLAKLPETRNGHAIRVMLACGMRAQELLAIKAEDIEPDGSAISITKAIKVAEGRPYLGSTKSDAGERLVYVPEFAQASAKWLRKNAQQDGWLFLSERGGYMYPRTFRDQYAAIMKELGIRMLTPHCCRHTFNTLHVVKLKTDPKVLQAQAGQSDMETTLGYAHVHDDDKMASASAYNKLIKSATEPKKRKRYKLVK
jgi:integrase